MKKWIAMLLAWMLCLCACGALAEEESLMQAVGQGYQAIDQSGNNGVNVQLSETQTGMIKVDLISETDTLVRPYIFVELNADFYQINHSEEDFSGVFGYTLNLLSQMQQSEEHRALTTLMNEALVPENMDLQSMPFANYGYVPDPQQRCEVLFVGVTDGEGGELIRDEIYAFCRFSMMGEGNTPLIMNALVTEQRAVFAIARMAHQTGLLSADMDAWLLRMLGY